MNTLPPSTGYVNVPAQVPGTQVNNTPLPSLPGTNLTQEQIAEAKRVGEGITTEGDGTGFPSLIEQEQARQEALIKAAEGKRKLNEELAEEQRQKELEGINKHRQEVLNSFADDLPLLLLWAQLKELPSLLTFLASSAKTEQQRAKYLIVAQHLIKMENEFLDLPLI